MSEFNFAMEASNRRAEKIREAREAAESLVDASEILRAAIERTENALSALADNEVVLKSGERLRERILAIKRTRNGMECFAFKCGFCESLDEARRDLV